MASPPKFALGLLLIVVSLGATDSRSNARADSGPADAGVADAGPLPAFAAEFREKARQIRGLIHQNLDLAVDPQSLFDVPLDSADESLRVESERLERLLATGAHQASNDTKDLDTTLGSDVWRARLDLDRARLEFYALPATRRAALVQTHREQQQQALARDHALALTQAEQDARHAEEQQRAALEAAGRASTEAARLINEEYARLLAVTRTQAQYESAMIQRKARLDARSEAVLAWRRRAAEMLAGVLDTAARSRMDHAYDELRGTLREARSSLGNALSKIGNGADRVPQAGPDRLNELPMEVDRRVALEQRRRVTEKASQLRAAERALELAEASQLMTEVGTLNSLRLELLAGLSADKRRSVLGFDPPGWDQAASEVRQVSLTLRYHLRSAYEWLREIKAGELRGSSAWVVFVLALEWAVPIGLFVWSRRHAEAAIDHFRRRQRERVRRQRHGDRFRANYAERVLVLLQRVHRPLEWLLLIGLLTWTLPQQVKGLLELRIASTALIWVFGGKFIVLAIDALSSERDRLLPLGLHGGAPNTASLRLRSLRLVGRATVGFGLALSLSELLVGRGTIYHWVFSSCWFAAIPLLFIIIGWWRPFIFERFARAPHQNAFESWVLANRNPPVRPLASVQSSIAAVAGGIYLFVRGAVRAVRGRVLSFEATRRLLAYLFRRDLSRKLRGGETSSWSELTAEPFRLLGPEVSSKELVHSAADADLERVIRTIQNSGGGAIALVGERGAGKTMLIERLLTSCTGPIAVSCTIPGTSDLRAQLNRALGLPLDANLEAAAQNLDRRGEGHALLIDDAQYLVRPSMGGLDELDRVLALLRRHSRHCTWILAFDQAVWRFIERSRSGQPLFDRVVRLGAWSEEAIVRLITSRNKAVGVKPDFSTLATEMTTSDDEIDRLEAERRTEANYYRLLWDYASGNPGVALHFWRRSLRTGDGGSVRVRLFEAPDMTQLEALPDSAAFVLRAIIQLGWADCASIVQVTSLPLSQVEDTLRYGNQRGYFDVDGDRYRVNWDWFRAVTRFLERRHLSFLTT